jgi:uncharacterized protein (DUF2141 family)
MLSNRMIKLSSVSVAITSFFISGLSVFTNASADEQLDIRPHEYADECDANISQVRVTVNNVGPGGILSVELYHDPKNFLNKKGRTRRIRIPATEESHEVCFTLEKQGVFAVAAYHDIDANRKLKKRWNMMPKEPFGLSGNPEMKPGFPKFENSAFTTNSLGADLIINLQVP